MLLTIVNPFEKLFARNVKLDHFPKFRGENQKHLKPPTIDKALLMAHQLRLVVYPMDYKLSKTSKRWLGMGFLNHQQHEKGIRKNSLPRYL